MLSLIVFRQGRPGGLASSFEPEPPAWRGAGGSPWKGIDADAGSDRLGGQIRIGITTYLKPGCSGTVISALALLSCSSIVTRSWLTLESMSIR